jgi:hypothetical protein
MTRYYYANSVSRVPDAKGNPGPTVVLRFDSILERDSWVQLEKLLEADFYVYGIDSNDPIVRWAKRNGENSWKLGVYGEMEYQVHYWPGYVTPVQINSED